MLNPYRFLHRSDHPLARGVRSLYRGGLNFSLPVPGPVARAMLGAYVAGREAYYFGVRVLVCEPLFKAYCREYGENVHTGTYVHWVQGEGDIILGDNVLLDGKCAITFASRYSDRPTLRIGSNSGLGHGCALVIGKEITIGDHCRIAGNVWIFDSSGHPTSPAARLAGEPAPLSEVRPVRICDNVWVGARAIVFPGVTIGEGSVVSAGAVVLGDVPPYTVVAGNPARKVAALAPGRAPIQAQS